MKYKLIFRSIVKSKFKDAQTWLDKNYPKNGKCIREKKARNQYSDGIYWDSSKFEKHEDFGKKRKEITELDIWNENLEGNLNLNDFTNLKKIIVDNRHFFDNRHFYSGNNLTSLNLTNCENLEEINCSNNSLTNIMLPTNSINLKKLFLGDNNFNQDLSFLENFTNLEELSLEDNKFYGSLKPLKKMEELKKLDISDTDIDRGLEYLPESVEEFNCSFLKRSKARVSDIWEELLPFKRRVEEKYWNWDWDDSGLKKWRKFKLDKQLHLTISPLLPPQLIDKIKKGNKFRENYGIPNTNYDEIHFSQWENIEEEFKKNKKELNFLSKVIKYLEKLENNLDDESLKTNLNGIELEWLEQIKEELRDKSKEEVNEQLIEAYNNLIKLPTKLYNIGTGRIEKTKANLSIKNYAVLSYVWGNPNMKVDEEIIEKYGLKTKEKLNISGSKALYKAIKACKHLKINHIWIDQLCINQNDNNEKTQQVSKMRQYYSNADYTLISINTELGDISDVDLMDILETIVSSKWFTRSWTFQEGWLSKHTIFMFDDKLIDGWAMAGTWALNQLKYNSEAGYSNRREFDKGTKKIATPVGWTYFRDGYDEDDKVEMTLNQALKEIKYRKRFLPIDGIYSILGLLPYGEVVEVDYKKTPQKALCEVMIVASTGYRKRIEPADYKEKVYDEEFVKKSLIDGKKVIEYLDKEAEKFAEPITWYGEGNSWLPQIDEYGSTSVEGGIEVKGVINFVEKGIQLYTTNYQIQEVDKNIYKRESGFEIEGGLYERKVKVEQGNWNKEQWEIETIELTLLGAKKTMKLVEKDVVLSIPSKLDFESLKPFALLLKDSGEMGGGAYNIPIFRRLGLIELGVGSEKLEGGIGEIIISHRTQEQLETKIEIPPKK